jgi:hypothetical protein
VLLLLLHAGEMTPLQPLRAAMRMPKRMANGFKVRPAAWLLALAQLNCHLHTQLHAARYLRAPSTLHFRCLRTPPRVLNHPTLCTPTCVLHRP